MFFFPTAIALGSSAIVKVLGKNCFRTLYGFFGLFFSPKAKRGVGVFFSPKISKLIMGKELLKGFVGVIFFFQTSTKFLEFPSRGTPITMYKFGWIFLRSSHVFHGFFGLGISIPWNFT